MADGGAPAGSAPAAPAASTPAKGVTTYSSIAPAVPGARGMPKPKKKSSLKKSKK